jgi:hypothetical protein
MTMLSVALSLLLATGNTPATSVATVQAQSSASAADQQARDAGGDSNPPTTPEQKAAGAAYRDYTLSLLHALRVSSDARDRALATQMAWLPDVHDGREQTVKDKASQGALLRDAAASAPDDALVQWIWAEAPPAESGCDAGPPCAHRDSAVVRLQPDNAAAWLPVFNAASDAGDSPATDYAIAQMALASRFDDQMGIAVKAWMDVYARYPIPASVVPADSPDAQFDDQDRGFVSSMEFAAAMSIGPYQSLMRACSRDRHPDASSLRLRDCAAIGRLMMTQATSMISRQIGRGILRVSGQATDADLASARALDWRYENWTKLVFASKQDDGARLKATARDWEETGDETQVMDRELERSGIALTPPASWQPTGRDGKPVSPLGEATKAGPTKKAPK